MPRTSRSRRSQDLNHSHILYFIYIRAHTQSVNQSHLLLYLTFIHTQSLLLHDLTSWSYVSISSFELIKISITHTFFTLYIRTHTHTHNQSINLISYCTSHSHTIFTTTPWSINLARSYVSIRRTHSSNQNSLKFTYNRKRHVCDLSLWRYVQWDDCSDFGEGRCQGSDRSLESDHSALDVLAHCECTRGDGVSCRTGCSTASKFFDLHQSVGRSVLVCLYCCSCSRTSCWRQVFLLAFVWTFRRVRNGVLLGNIHIVSSHAQCRSCSEQSITFCEFQTKSTMLHHLDPDRCSSTLRSFDLLGKYWIVSPRILSDTVRIFFFLTLTKPT